MYNSTNTYSAECPAGSTSLLVLHWSHSPPLQPPVYGTWNNSVCLETSTLLFTVIFTWSLGTIEFVDGFKFFVQLDKYKLLVKNKQVNHLIINELTISPKWFIFIENETDPFSKFLLCFSIKIAFFIKIFIRFNSSWESL